MHNAFWAGVDLKIAQAERALSRMGSAIAPPERTGTTVAILSSNAMVGAQWQEAFYDALDAFLASARSVPDIIHACYGADKVVTHWWTGLGMDEQGRRETFTTQFRAAYKQFKGFPLTTARHITLHRLGYPPVEVVIGGPGGTHIGTPVQPVPTAYSKFISAGDDPALQFAATQPPRPLQPTWADFRTNGAHLLPACRAYLEEARNLVALARTIAQNVHGSQALTPPPS